MNQQPTRNKKPILLAAIALVLVIALFAAVYIANRPATQAGEKTLTIIVVHADESEETFAFQTDAEYLQEALEAQNLIEGSESEFGLFVETVNGETANAALQQWWCLTKNGEMHTLGVGDTPVIDGDQYELTLTTGW